MSAPSAHRAEIRPAAGGLWVWVCTCGKTGTPGRSRPRVSVAQSAHVQAARAAEVKARRRTCEPHGGAFKAQFESVVFRCGHGCEEIRPEWATDHGWAVRD